ncbi:DUF6928 family protein [Humibacillus xanthopallidus]|uniref:Uncharacterized protein n=1 Tax=Humibacillus xanthopallidus TaxID=412689 RepID=A0A543I2V0_9MICO|nr:hypothetical protein [Humibacillus xanthopallidus]TQM64924.1 hypothetical protein FBY41_1306 [Humibacillus xanthopallidus]
MGAKDCLICYADNDVPSVLAARPALDRAATEALVRRLFADHTVTPEDGGTLGENANPPDGRVFAAVWPGAGLVCTSAVALDRPSLLDHRFLAAGAGRTVHVHAMHSVVDWTAFATWGPDGGLRRALSVSGADGEILEDLGDRLPFEEPFWAGAFPAVEDEDDDYPFPFHPLELGEAALHHLFGFVLEGFSPMTAGESVDPFDVTLAGFRVTPGRRRRLFRRR